MGLLKRLLGGQGEDGQQRGEQVGGQLDAMAQLDPKWSTEKVRRRVRDAFFAVERSWIERDPSIGDPFMASDLRASQKLRIDGLVNQNRVHQLENPLIEDLDFVRFDEGTGPEGTGTGQPEVVVMLDVSLVETILDAQSGALVAGAPGVKQRRRQFWSFAWQDGKWMLADVEQPDAGARHLNAPLVGGDFAELSPEMILRERYAREEIEVEEFEAEMAKLLGRERTY